MLDKEDIDVHLHQQRKEVERLNDLFGDSQQPDDDDDNSVPLTGFIESNVKASFELSTDDLVQYKKTLERLTANVQQ